MGDIEDEKGGASLYQRALAIYNEGSDEWCIPNRGTPAWSKLEAIRDSLTTRSKPKPRATAKRATAKRAKPKVATTPRATAKRATFKRNIVKPSAKASDAPLREALANLSNKRNRVITIPRTIVGRTDEPTTDKQDASLAKLEAKLDKAITTATDAAAVATATATTSASATDAKLKKLTRKLKDATAATTAAAVATATAPAVNTATASDGERKLMKLANKLKLATDTAAAATIANNATADAKLSKLVADLRVANAQAAASASAADAKLFRLTAELERATRAALSTLPQTPERQSALSKVASIAANVGIGTATMAAKGVATVGRAVGRKAVEYAASKVAPVPPVALPTDIQTQRPASPDTRIIPEGKQEVSPRPRRAKQAKPAQVKPARPTTPAPQPPREPPARDAPPPPIPEREPPSPKVKTVKAPSPKRSAKVPKQDKPMDIPEGKQPASDIVERGVERSVERSVPLMGLPDIVIKHRVFLDAAREVGEFSVEDMGRPLLTEHMKVRRDNAFKRYKREWKEASDKYRAERKDVNKTDYNKLTKSGEATALIISKARANIKLFGEQGGNIRARVEEWMTSPTLKITPTGSPRASAEDTEGEFEESAVVGSETETPQSQPLESIDISSIASPSSQAARSRVDESRDIPADPFGQFEAVDIIGQGFHNMTPEEFVINQMRRAVYGDEISNATGGLRPIFCRQGNKSRILKQVLSRIPPHTTYVEPFIGSGAVFFAKDKSPKSVITDLDADIIAMYKLANKIKLSDIPKVSPLKTEADYYTLLNTKSNNPVKVLASFILRYCGGFAGAPVTDKIAGSKFSDPYNKIFKLGEYQDKMKGVVLKRADYRDVIAEYDSANTFFYLDPPYEKSNKQQYKHFGFDYEEFRDIVSKIKGKFLISINDSPYIRELFRGFKIESVILPASGSHQTKPRRELFISG